MFVRWILGGGALLLALAPLPASAQSPSDAYFHEAAQEYIDDNVSAAQQAVQRGLEIAPSDPRLLALQEKLQQSGRPGDDGSQQTGSAESSNEKSDSPQSSGEGESRPESSEQPDDPASEWEDPSALQPDDEASDRDAQQQRGEVNREDAAPLSRTQAERLLQALEEQEKRLLREIQTRSSETSFVEKDW